jgi:hypothetical protein
MTSPNIATTHAFTTRFGGVSSGIYESLNLAQRAEDCIENVKENYSRLCSALDVSPDSIVCSTQVHGTHVRVVTRDDCGRLFKSNPQNADALITNTPGIALMVFVADCVPILLYDPVKRVAGAVHAGWRGTVADITGITVSKMINEFGCSPADINAAIGPCISKCCFETDADVTDAVIEALNEDACNCFTKNGDKYNVDLKETNRILLKNAGIENISISDECTSCSSDKYWSHRKTQGQRGSQVAVIVIKDDLVIAGSIRNPVVNAKYPKIAARRPQ